MGGVPSRSTRSLGVMKTGIATILVCCPAIAIAGAYADDLGKGPRYRLFFPAFERVETDTHSGRVANIEVVVKCGYVTGLSKIPGDWWVSLRGPISGETTIVAEAGHGASYLWRLETWNGSITITPFDASCFDVSARVFTDNEPPRELTYTRRQLKLMP
jgi:hypothetical protein